MVIARRSRGHLVRWSVLVAIALSACGIGVTSAGARSTSPSAPSSTGGGISGYIVGGHPVAAGEFPSLAAIMRDQPSLPPQSQLICTGTVVAPRWILSAGHCSMNLLFGLPIKVQVRSRDLGGVGAQTVRIDRATVHYRYYRLQAGYDIALLHTASAVVAPPTRLATPFEPPVPAGGFATAVGWGMTKRLGVQEPPGPDATIPIRARAVRIPIVGDASCATTFADFQPGYFVPISDLCAGTAGHNVCFGDSGGPLYAQDRGALVQIGITSRGAGCATRLFPSIFTDVRRLAPWILRNMANACTTQVPGGASIPGQPAAPLFAC